jgi:hypothetical protein
VTQAMCSRFIPKHCQSKIKNAKRFLIRIGNKKTDSKTAIENFLRVRFSS